MTNLKRSGKGELLGNPEPTFSVVPPYAYSELEECLDTCALGGLNPFEWQQFVLSGWLGRTLDGKWAALNCGLAVPRQNGKSLGTAEARANYGMLVLGEQVIYTAHLQKTATETFEDMASFFTDHKATNKHLKTVKEALGREQIILKNGARIKFLARTRAGGRGQHGELLVFDEAQELDSSQQASFLFAISAARNPQTIYMGTPPDETSTPGLVFKGIRKRAKQGSSKRTSWHEWSVPEIPENVHDESIWARTNPSLGITIQRETIEAEVEQTEPDEFSRERLGWWSDKEIKDAVFSADEWGACKTDAPEPTDDEIISLGIKFTSDGSHVAISAATKSAFHKPFVELIYYEPMNMGTTWIAEWINERKRTIAEVCIDGKSNVDALVGKLQKLHFPDRAIKVMGAADVIAASSMLYDAVIEGSLIHAGQELLADSMTKTRKRTVGSKESGGWSFGDGVSDAAPAESVASAYRSVMTTKRNPRRKQRCS